MSRTKLIDRGARGVTPGCRSGERGERELGATCLPAQGLPAFVPPPFPDTHPCGGNPGYGLLPVLSVHPNGHPTYSFLLFELSGRQSSRGPVHMIRADLYRGQPCARRWPVRLTRRNGYYPVRLMTRKAEISCTAFSLRPSSPSPC